MAVYGLSRIFRRLNIYGKEIISAYYSTQQAHLTKVNSTHFLPLLNVPPKILDDTIKFTARSSNLTFDIPRNGFPISKIIENPLIPNLQIEDPLKNRIEQNDIVPNKIVEVPPSTNIVEKHAVRLIVIRRKKMKKHKRRKFLKKMKFVIRKKEQRKQIMKEKIFQADLQNIYQEALQFNAKQYVADRIETLTKERLPNKYRGEFLPEHMIRQFLKEKADKKAYKKRLHEYRLKLD